MHEILWYHLYLQVIMAEGKRKTEINEQIEFLLPWLNLELWDKVQENKKEGRENVAYEAQLQAALRGDPMTDVWNPDANTPMSGIDDLVASVREQDMHETKPKRGPDTAEELFKQARQPMPGSIKSTIFEG